jgi:hypothetical protein
MIKKQILNLLLIPVAFGLVVCSVQDNQAQINEPTITESEQQWRQMTQQEEHQELLSIINHKMGVAALNQLALEGFTGYDCERRFYVNDYYGGMQTLMRIECANPRGASSAIGFDEARVIFNRFESNIENFEIQRRGEEVTQFTFPLPD